MTTNTFPPHRTFKSQHSLNYLSLCHTLVPNPTSVLELVKAAQKVPLDDIPHLLPEVRTIAITRSKATLQRARSDTTKSPQQLKAYERYLGLAINGRSLFEQTLDASFNKRLRNKPDGALTNKTQS